MLFIVSQTNASGDWTPDQLWRFVEWAFVVIAATSVATWLMIWFIRRWVRKDDDIPPGGFSLHDLRKLKQAGKMSEEEFKVTSALLAKTHSAHILKPKPDKTPPPTDGDASGGKANR